MVAGEESVGHSHQAGRQAGFIAQSRRAIFHLLTSYIYVLIRWSIHKAFYCSAGIELAYQSLTKPINSHLW